MGEFLQNLDFSILDFIKNTFTCEFLDWLAPKVSLINNGGYVWIIFAVVFICIRKYRKVGIMMLIGLLAGVIIGNVILKNLIERARPCWINTSVSLLIPNPTDFSFPSGHAQSSFIAATLMTLKIKKWGWISIPLALMISFSRLYLYVHFPSDIIGGGIIGICIALVTIKCYGLLEKRFQAHVG